MVVAVTDDSDWSEPVWLTMDAVNVAVLSSFAISIVLSTSIAPRWLAPTAAWYCW